MHERPEVHICLLSEQPSPNICPVLDERLRPKRLVMLVTPQQRSRVDGFEAVLKPRGVSLHTVELPDAFDADRVAQVVEAEIDRAGSDQRVMINATGGTKPMSIGAYMAGYARDVPVFYVHDDQVIWLHKAPGPGFALNDTLRLKDFLRVHGVELLHHAPTNIAPELRTLARELIDTPALGPGVRYLNWVGCECRDAGRLFHDMKDDAIHKEEYQALLDKYQRQGLIHLKRNELRFASEDARNWCLGTWLEDFIAGVVQRLRPDPDLRIQDTMHSVEVRYVGEERTRGQRDRAENELDVVILANNQLYLIECKTRAMKTRTRFDPTDSLYKLATLKRELGGSQARAMLASYFDISDVHRRRAKVLGLEVCAGREIREIESRIRRWIAPPSAG